MATTACLNAFDIPRVVLEKEDCYAPLWKKKTYDWLKLHLAKEFYALPPMQHLDSALTYITKDDFVRYLDEYVKNFDISPMCNTIVESVSNDEECEVGIVKVRDTATGEEDEYAVRFSLVVIQV